MNRPNTRNSTTRWRALGNATLALAAVAVIGFMSVAPAKADDDDWRNRNHWREREWREHQQRYGVGLSFSSPGYYYSYPSYSYSYPSYSYSYSYPSYAYSYSYPSYGYYYSYPSYDYYGGSDYGYDYSR